MKIKLNKIIGIVMFGAVILMPLASFAVEGEVKLLPPIQASSENDTDSLNTSIDEAIQNTEVVTPKVEDIQEMTPNANDDIRKEVVNDADNHMMDVIKKFLFCMAAVLVSSVFLFVIGTVMNKFNLLERFKKEESTESEEIPTSNDENDALKIFFDVTK